MHEVMLRPADDSDIPAVIELVTSAYRGDASRAGWTTEADLLHGSRIDADLVKHDLHRDRSVVLVAEATDRPRGLIGCVHVTVVDEHGYLGMFAVAPGRQGGGLGSEIMTAAEEFVVDQWGMTAMEMTVIDVRHELLAFYQRRGYQPTGQVVPFPYGDERFGTPQRSDLQLAVLRKELTNAQ